MTLTPRAPEKGQAVALPPGGSAAGLTSGPGAPVLPECLILKDSRGADGSRERAGATQWRAFGLLTVPWKVIHHPTPQGLPFP